MSAFLPAIQHSVQRAVQPAVRRAEATASQLRHEIISGLAAPGNLLAESAVAVRLGVSRVPVREALFTLEREGLVEFGLTGRAFVKQLTPTDFEEIFVLRLTLEPMAARLAAANLRKDCSALHANLTASQRSNTIEEVTRLDLEFHEIILAAAGNERLLKLWCSVRGELELWLGRLHRQHQFRTQETGLETVIAHQRIIDTFRTQSRGTCERVMRAHILGWRKWLPIVTDEGGEV